MTFDLGSNLKLGPHFEAISLLLGPGPDVAFKALNPLRLMFNRATDVTQRKLYRAFVGKEYPWTPEA